MTEDRDYQGGDEKEHTGEGEKDVEGHSLGIERSTSDGETDEPDVEAHTVTPNTSFDG
jgi:hypothetical protein